MNIFLIIIGFILVITNIYRLKKEESKHNKKGTLGNKKNGFKYELENKNKSLSDYDVKFAIFQNKINEQITFILDEIENLKKTVKDNQIISENNDDKKDNYSSVNHLKENVIEKYKNDNKKIKNDNADKVNNLIKQNYTINQIADKLNISKGEVLLIKDLYLK